MEIPSWPASRAIGITDKPHLDRLFAIMQPSISELTFAGLYLFRDAHGYRLSSLLGSTVILGRGYDGAPYCLPPLGGDPLRAAGAVLDSGIPLYGADGTMAAQLSSSGALCHELRDSFDYLYRREELATLPGTKFHKKRNRIAYFSTRHAGNTEQFQPHHLPGCLALLTNWVRTAAREESPSLSFEVSATREALEQAGTLGLEGVVIRVGQEVKAFALGERLNRETAVCHFEKADPFMEGLAQLVNREFARLLFSDCHNVNREQDLGLPGLRNAKLSYHPIELVKKWHISRQRPDEYRTPPPETDKI